MIKRAGRKEVLPNLAEPNFSYPRVRVVTAAELSHGRSLFL